MEDLLGPEGALARLKEDFQFRPQQGQMLKAVMKAFSQSRFLLAEAPTGVGKSLAYLLPALTWAAASQERVVVATHTVYLQEQLFRKEIPQARQLLPFDFNCALLKGRGNYLCLNRFREVLRRGANLIWGERVLLARLAVWLEEGAAGDLDAIRLLGPERDWFSQMASSRETCQGSRCPYFKDCFYQRARLAAAKSDLLIVNHALLLADACLGEAVLGKYRYLIIDEAHHLEEEGTRHFTREFSLIEYEKYLQQLHRRRDVFGRPGFIQYLKDYRQTDAAGLEQLEPWLEELEKKLKQVLRRVNALQELLKNANLPETGRVRPGGPQGSAEAGLLASLDNLRVVSGELTPVLRRLSLALAGEAGQIFEETWLKSQQRVFERVLSLSEILDCFLQGTAGQPAAAEPEAGPAKAARPEAGPTDAPGPAEAEGEQVYWFQRDQKTNNLTLCVTPLNTAGCFRKYLLADKESLVLTSATLSVGGKFDYCSEQLGLDPELTDRLILCSPFDYQNQVLLLTDQSLPDPARTPEAAYNRALAASLEQLLAACGGRTMVLFTAHKQLRAMYDALAAKLKALGLELFADGVNGSRSTLMEELQANPQAIVFGASTFWEGVDLPGLSLTSLLIVRLPFAPPGLPMTEARIEQLAGRGQDPFYQYSLPQAVLRFKQGYGRLIRTAQDWGTVVVLDNRIVNKRYGRVFLRSLPGGGCLAGPPEDLARRIRSWRQRFLGEEGSF